MMDAHSARPPRWTYIAPTVLAILAIVISIVAWVFAYRADVVNLNPLTGNPQLDAYRGQVEELQRANDRILNTAWTTLGVVVTLATVLVTFNFIRGERVLEQERSIIEERFGVRMQQQRDEVSGSIAAEKRDREQVESELRVNLDRLTSATEQLANELREERRNRAALEFEFFRYQHWVHDIVRDITESRIEFFPYVYTRVYGGIATALRLLRPAIESERPDLIKEALDQLKGAVQQPITEAYPIPVDYFIQMIRSLPADYNPLRDEVIDLLRRQPQRHTDAPPQTGV